MRANERIYKVVPRPWWWILLLALALQIAWQLWQPRPLATAAALMPPPPADLVRIASAGEPVAFAQLITLYLQAFDNQPGVSVPFRELDYQRVVQWLETILDLDPVGQYPLLMAAQVYGQVNDQQRQRVMLSFVHQQFSRDPDRRWRWLAHAAIMAKHRLHDDALALRYAQDIARYATTAPHWARQMQIFLLEDLGEVESARILLGGLLASGEITDQHELRFLMERLEAMQNAEKSSNASKH